MNNEQDWSKATCFVEFVNRNHYEIILDVIEEESE